MYIKAQRASREAGHKQFTAQPFNVACTILHQAELACTITILPNFQFNNKVVSTRTNFFNWRNVFCKLCKFYPILKNHTKMFRSDPQRKKNAPLQKGARRFSTMKWYPWYAHAPAAFERKTPFKVGCRGNTNSALLVLVQSLNTLCQGSQKQVLEEMGYAISANIFGLTLLAITPCLQSTTVSNRKSPRRGYSLSQSTVPVLLLTVVLGRQNSRRPITHTFVIVSSRAHKTSTDTCHSQSP